MFLDLVRMDIPLEEHKREVGLHVKCVQLYKMRKKKIKKRSGKQCGSNDTGDSDSDGISLKGLFRTAFECTTTCNVALCASVQYWNLFHHSNLGIH